MCVMYWNKQTPACDIPFHCIVDSIDDSEDIFIPYFLSREMCAHPHDGWTGFYRKLCVSLGEAHIVDA